MTLVELKDLFHIEYGNQLDINKIEKSSSKDSINFVSRQSNNLGVYCKVNKIDELKIYKKGSITVTLGGSYLLSSFVQEEDFYTGQNIKVLTPKTDMNNLQKQFYCYVIMYNRYRYSSHGREANKTLDNLLVPSIYDLPYLKLPNNPSKNPYHNKQISLNDREWKSFMLKELFDMQRGREIVSNCKKGSIPLISSSDLDNGLNTYIREGDKLFKGNAITVANNGSVGSCFYQKENFYATSDITVLTSPLLNQYNALFITSLISNEKYRFNYGRKWGLDRMKDSKIKLPINKQNEPDWDFMEDFIKTLPYSNNLETEETT